VEARTATVTSFDLCIHGVVVLFSVIYDIDLAKTMQNYAKICLNYRFGRKMQTFSFYGFILRAMFFSDTRQNCKTCFPQDLRIYGHY
jgi:hypothetical protein